MNHRLLQTGPWERVSFEVPHDKILRLVENSRLVALAREVCARQPHPPRTLDFWKVFQACPKGWMVGAIVIGLCFLLILAKDPRWFVSAGGTIIIGLFCTTYFLELKNVRQLICAGEKHTCSICVLHLSHDRVRGATYPRYSMLADSERGESFIFETKTKLGDSDGKGSFIFETVRLLEKEEFTGLEIDVLVKDRSCMAILLEKRYWSNCA